MEKELNEPVLDDSFPVFFGYLYVVDGRVERSEVNGTVADLKEDQFRKQKSAIEVRRCDIKSRNLWHLAL